MSDMPFSEVLEIAEFGSVFEAHLNMAVKGPPIPDQPQPKKDRFVMGKGNTGQPRTLRMSEITGIMERTKPDNDDYNQNEGTVPQ